MDALVVCIKVFLKKFADDASKAERIESVRDYRRVAKWVKKVKGLYLAFSLIAVWISFMLYAFSRSLGIPHFFAYTILPAMILLTCWGYATLILYLPGVIKSVIKAGKMGYQIGQSVETTHIQVTHEYGDTYRVSSYTENKGCLFAYIGGFLQWVIWAFFCVYIGPFLTFKKLKESKKALKNTSFK